MSNEFAIGDIVQLKSGGPKMTVKNIEGYTEDSIRCQWFSGSKLQDGWFRAKTLVKVEESDE